MHYIYKYTKYINIIVLNIILKEIIILFAKKYYTFSHLDLFSFKTPTLDEKIKLYTHILLVY